MYIAVFSTDDHLPPAGGAEIAFREIAKRCPEHTFHLFCARLRRQAPRKETIGNVIIERIGFGIPRIDGLLLALFGARRAQALHRRQPFQLVWSILASYGGFAGSQLARQTKIPFLLTLQEGTETAVIERRTRFIKPFFRRIFRTADGLQAISSHLLDWGIRMGFSGRISRVIPNGVELDAFSPLTPPDRARVRARWNIPEDSLLLMTASRLVPKNGMGDVIAALPSLPGARFLICGDGPLRATLQQQAKKAGVSERVIFAGFIPHEALPEIFAASDIFVRPSRSEGLGNAFLEAMAAGIPVIGTAVGGIPDFLREKETGFLCAPNNPSDLARTVQYIIAAGPEHVRQITTAARALISERFTWDRTSLEMKKIFVELTKEKLATYN